MVAETHLRKSRQELVELLAAPAARGSLVSGLLAIVSDPDKARGLPGTNLVLQVLAPCRCRSRGSPLPWRMQRSGGL